MLQVFLPLTSVNIAFNRNKLAISVPQISLPISIVKISVGPSALPTPMSLAILRTSRILSRFPCIISANATPAKTSKISFVWIILQVPFSDICSLTNLIISISNVVWF